MIKEILPGIFCLKIPLPGNPLQALNSYLIKGEKRSLLVDTGFNWPECREAQLTGMRALGLEWSQVDFFITHVHGDHSGLVYALADKESKVYCSKTDADIMRSSMQPPYWQEINAFFLKHGFPKESMRNQAETITNFISGTDLNFTYVDELDVLEIGSYRLVCIATPGHTPGHLCLYEPEHRFFIAGDHILATITSNITVWPGLDDALGQYLVSLDKVYAMDIRLVLPGHREMIQNHCDRIAELKQHHQKRLLEIRSILAQGPLDAYQVASRMHWDLTYRSWESFPNFQKWFATGEAIAHLEHLIRQNRAQKTEKEEKLIYSLQL